MNWVASILIFFISIMLNLQMLSDEMLTEIPDVIYQEEQEILLSDADSTAEVMMEVQTESAEVPAVSVCVETVAAQQEEDLRIIVIGDSRTVSLYCAMTYSAEEFPAHVFYHISPDYSAFYENTMFSAKGGEGYPWFSVYGAAMAVSNMTENTAFVVWLGVNDLDRVNNYIEYVNYTLLPFGAPVYYMTIGPCDGNWSDSNPAVLSFNESLRAGLLPEVRIIDMHAFISEGMASGRFATTDGMHYNYETSRAVYQHMMEVVEADMKMR